MARYKKFIKGFFNISDFLIAGFYGGLIIALIIYFIHFTFQVWELTDHFTKIDPNHMNHMMIALLNLVDAAMIAYLIKIIVTGTDKESFDELSFDEKHEKIGSGFLKVKIGSVLIGVSSIHLLETFVLVHLHESYDITAIVIQCFIHIIFIFSTLALAAVDYLHQITKSTFKKP